MFALRSAVLVGVAIAAVSVSTLHAQGSDSDYRRALTLSETYEGLVANSVDNVRWLDSSRFSFRRTEIGGHRFFVMNASSGEETPAFDHERIAQSISRASGSVVTANKLPFTAFNFISGANAIQTSGAVGSGGWRCTLSDYSCTPSSSGPGMFGGGMGGFGQGGTQANQPKVSPDRTMEAVVRNFNIEIRKVGEREVLFATQDGSEGNAYSLQSVVWSPDSKRLAVYRVVPGYERLVHYVESSPQDQLQPKYFTRNYTKPGDVLDLRQPVIVDIAKKSHVFVDTSLFPNAYSLSAFSWRADGREVTFEYNQRGHEVYRIIGVNAATAEARAVVSEEPETFFYYRPASGGGKYYRYDINDGREIIWMSERDGWNHLYLMDGTNGKVKHQITSGEWVVRSVLRIDEANGHIYFAASGRHKDQDPYFVHYYRIGIDGTGLTPLSEANGEHTLAFSPDGKYYVLTWSRPDLPHITELRRTSDRSKVAEVGRGDNTALLAAGWRPPEVFVAKGRDGVTDIWGVIYRPSNFDASKKYPVIESIYAGPHGHHVPKQFMVFPDRGAVPQAEIGFIVVQIDGMGTSNRSKAFHDVAWKNLADAGFPDRILWHKEVAKKYDYYDLTRVGIYGGSAGGQNAMGALLFHGDFYHAAVADNGCHDNRMDKIWWNELWMSWPLGSHYSASSNVDNAYRLKGKLLLTVGELDSNVDPSSTYQVANALIKAGKEFDLLMIPGGEHARGPYHERKRFDFFVKHLLNGTPPDWNSGGVLADSENGN